MNSSYKLTSLHVAAAALLVFVFVFLSNSPVWHTDVWGHLRFGEYIMREHRLPEHEMFSGDYADQERPYLNFQWLAQVDYTPSGNADNRGTLTGRIEHLNLGSFTVSAGVDFGATGLAGNPVFYGFTAGNGLATDGHIVTSAVPVPEPQAWAMLLARIYEPKNLS